MSLSTFFHSNKYTSGPVELSDLQILSLFKRCNKPGYSWSMFGFPFGNWQKIVNYIYAANAEQLQSFIQELKFSRWHVCKNKIEGPIFFLHSLDEGSTIHCHKCNTGIATQEPFGDGRNVFILVNCD